MVQNKNNFSRIFGFFHLLDEFRVLGFLEIRSRVQLGDLGVLGSNLGCHGFLDGTLGFLAELRQKVPSASFCVSRLRNFGITSRHFDDLGIFSSHALKRIFHYIFIEFLLV